MKSVVFVCLFALLISMLVLAQSNRAQVLNQPNGPPISQQRHPALPPRLSQMSLGAILEQGRNTGSKATASRRGALPTKGLDFANAVAYNSSGYYPYSAAVADVNGDGKPDVLVANSCASSTNCNNGTIAVCSYASKDGIPRKIVFITYVEPSAAAAKDNFAKLKMWFGPPTPVAGVGDDAYRDSNYAIHVQKGRVRYYINMIPIETYTPEREK